MKKNNANKKVGIKRLKSQRFSLTLSLAALIIAFLFVSFAIAAVAVWAILEAGIVESDMLIEILLIILLFVAITTIIIFSFVVLLGRFPLRPFNEYINQMNRLASGDFTARLHFGRMLSRHRTFREIEESFNELAEELEKTEMLRQDFINNFSHEFKTPIVSIAGLAKLVNKGNLSEEQKQEYFVAIEKESLRLANMATNVLNLTKVENQTILSETTTYNVSEQIRTCVLLLENQWACKNIDLSLDFEEHELEANEELLKQIWINLLDNAIKFSPDGARVTVDIVDKGSELSIVITNEGKGIPPESLDKIWNKFYQADESHATKGNGVGLAIVKKIVKLHYGHISVKSEDGETSFRVTLPKKQKKLLLKENN